MTASVALVREIEYEGVVFADAADHVLALLLWHFVGILDGEFDFGEICIWARVRILEFREMGCKEEVVDGFGKGP